MNSVEKLIQELCPDGVKFVKLGEVCETVTDYTAAGSFADVAKNVIYNREPDFALLVRTTDIKSNFTKGDFVYINEHAFNYLWRVNLDKVSLIMPNVGNCGEVYYLTKEQLPYEKCCLAPNALLLRSSSQNMRFLFHLLKTDYFQNKLKKIISPVGQTKFNKTELKQIEIPLPPLAIQSRIVEILDNFSSLTAELQAELQARRSQYEYYRNHLLSFDGYDNIQNENNTTTNNSAAALGKTVKWVKLREIGEITRGSSFQKIHFQQSGVPCIHYGQIYTYYKTSTDKTISFVSEELAEGRKLAKTGDVIITTTSENIEDVGTPLAWLGEDDILISNHACFLRHNQNTKYITYVLQSELFYQFKRKKARGTKVIDIKVDDLLNFEFPLPSLSEQRRIADILDRFEALTTDLQCGLPAEIQARQQQYEYYRNKLLTFERCV